MIAIGTISVDPRQYSGIARRYLLGADTFDRLVNPLTPHVVRESILQVPRELPYTEQERVRRQGEITNFCGELFQLNPLLKVMLEGPISVELQQMSGYDIYLSKRLWEIREKPLKGKAFSQEELEKANEEARGINAKLGKLKSPKISGFNADARAWRNEIVAAIFDEVQSNPNGSAIPTLMAVYPPYTLAVLTANDFGIYSNDSDERVGTLNLIAKLLFNARTKILNAKEIDDDFKDQMKAITLARGLLDKIQNDNEDKRFNLNAIALNEIAKVIMDQGIERFTQLKTIGDENKTKH